MLYLFKQTQTIKRNKMPHILMLVIGGISKVNTVSGCFILIEGHKESISIKKSI